AARGGVPAVGVDDDFAAGETAVSIRSGDHEIAGRIDQEIGGLLRHPTFRQSRFDRVGDHLLDQPWGIFLAVAALRIVLRGDDDLRATDRLAVDVTDRDLTL